MNKYWPVIMWCYDVTDDGALKYMPSQAHANDLRWCYTEGDAILYGLRRIKDQQNNNIHAMPTFVVKVINSKTKPNVLPGSPIRMLVQRIPLA